MIIVIKYFDYVMSSYNNYYTVRYIIMNDQYVYNML